MKLTEINLENRFMIIIKGDFRDADYVEKQKTFLNDYFEQTIAFLTIIQDIYNKKSKLEENQKRLDIAQDLDDYIKIYFEKYTNTNIMNFSQYADSCITDEVSIFMPEIIFDDYFYPRTIEDITIVKDSRVYTFDKNQSDEDIKQAQKYVIDWLKIGWNHNHNTISASLRSFFVNISASGFARQALLSTLLSVKRF